jgi:hypothetical protein
MLFLWKFSHRHFNDAERLTWMAPNAWESLLASSLSVHDLEAAAQLVVINKYRQIGILRDMYFLLSVHVPTSLDHRLERFIADTALVGIDRWQDRVAHATDVPETNFLRPRLIPTENEGPGWDGLNAQQIVGRPWPCANI